MIHELVSLLRVKDRPVRQRAADERAALAHDLSMERVRASSSASITPDGSAEAQGQGHAAGDAWELRAEAA